MKKSFHKFTAKRVMRKMYGKHCRETSYGTIHSFWVDIASHTYSVIVGKDALQLEGLDRIKHFVAIL